MLVSRQRKAGRFCIFYSIKFYLEKRQGFNLLLIAMVGDLNAQDLLDYIIAQSWQAAVLTFKEAMRELWRRSLHPSSIFAYWGRKQEYLQSFSVAQQSLCMKIRTEAERYSVWRDLMWAARELTQNRLESLRLYYGKHTSKPVGWLKKIDIAAELDKGLSILQREKGNK